MITPVILAGGSGTRLWPVSRHGYPKQFVRLLDKQFSLFQTTLLRASKLGDPSGKNIAVVHQSSAHDEPIVVCGEENRFMVAEQLLSADMKATIILEPVGRNTAPAVAFAALTALQAGKESPLLVMPSDHEIQVNAAFNASILKAVNLAKEGKIVTFGILPASAETGYGYIQRGEPVGLTSASDSAPNSALGFEVSRFVEKPDIENATAYCQSGEYYWNSGMFVVSPDVYLAELEKYAPDIFEVVHKVFDQRQTDLDFMRLPLAEFESLRSESIDFAVMEHTKVAAVVPLETEWSDVGSWAAVADALVADTHGNTTLGDVILEDCSSCLVRSDSRLVATIGLTDTIVVETADAVLVANKDSTQSVKTIVSQLKAQSRSEALHHTRVFRPWGWYETVCLCDRFQVKRIQVTPGHTLSLQMHHHRAEHWVVVRGTAEITRGDEVVMLTEDESTYIKLGVKHRLANPGKIPLEIIEVQTGSYLGEDDIVRFEDTYGRDT